ncbi:hypothetical protein [Paenibacillus glucanolyticus]|uniref:hypothetical protein n=1 Tax=Paenibacillus glucanolyticus TaxID=59843 RepID=UPI00096E3C3E|nr:hypothetical protein [Paenibacillus glucanolyticus]OMF76789.1 hypothetical protein BK142_14820 [Paenibacillus glucanolyticus]
MTSEKVHKPRRRGTRQALSIALAAALLIPSVLMPGKNAVEGAGHANVVSVNSYNDLSNPRTTTVLKLSDGRSVRFKQYVYGDTTQLEEIPSDVKKQYNFNGNNDDIVFRLMNNGELYIKERKVADPTRSFRLLDSNVVDFAYIDVNAQPGFKSDTTSFFVLRADGTVDAFGRGDRGQLGIGVKQDKTVPTEVLDPDKFDTPLSGVKKLIQLSYNNVLLVTDSSVYKIGEAFGSSSFTAAKPLNITSMFSAFTSADNFEMGYLDNAPGSFGEYNTSGGVRNYPQTDLRYFKVSGSYYSLTDTGVMSEYIKTQSGNVFDELKSTRLYPLQISDHTKAYRALTDYQVPASPYGYSTNLSNTYFELESNGDLTHWGNPIEYMGNPNSGYMNSKRTLIPNVVKYTVSPNIDYAAVIALGSNGNVYAMGNNGNRDNTSGGNKGITGISGRLLTPTRVAGPDNDVKGIIDIANSINGLYALRDNGTIYYLSGSTYAKINSVKFVGLLDIPTSTSPNGTQARAAYAFGEDGNIYRLEGSTPVKQEGATGIYPPGYTPAPTTIDKPTEGIRLTDKFENTIITLNYPTVANKKEYSLDNGATWLDYTAPITLTNKGVINLKARAGLDSLYSEILDISFLNNPIVIPAGYPKLLEQDGVLTVDTGSIDLNRVKVQLDVDGQLADYTSPISLQEGDYVVTAIVSNRNNEELTRVTENITVDPPVPGTITAPVGTVGDPDANNQRPLTIIFNPTQGSLQIQHDGGPWVDEADILNQYNGISEDPSATERKYTLYVDNILNSVYKARVTNGTNFSSETSLILDGVDYDPSFTRDINDKLLIDFSNIPTGNWYKEYSIDNGASYHEYTGPIDIGAYLPIKVRITDPSTGQVLTDKEYTTPPLNGGSTGPGPGIPVGQEEVDFTVHSGGLSSRFEGADLSTIVIDNTNPYQAINAVSRVFIEDSRGNGKGYHYSIDVTDFVSDPLQDNSTNSKNLVVSIPANALSVDVLNTKTINGPAAELSNVGKHVFTGNGPEMLATAQAFEGMGYNEIPLNFTLSVPDRVKIVSSGSGSKFVAGESTGLMAGIYKSKFTITLTSGI